MSAVEKHTGAEPLAGYRLLKLLGRGGFGEVWKCEAPGCLHKAIKFVAGGDQFRTELAAFEHVRTIRHPYLMTLERVEAVAGELIMVMELADGQINDRFRACVADRLPGIPRDELLGYLKEAAEALDFLSSRYGLQHLDVKPENLLLLAGHVKLGDYGLVRRADSAQAADERQNGFTPRYTAPEILDGGVDHRSDQYSLALVYMELLTGVFPYSGKTAQQILIQHVTAVPDLSPLPAPDRAVVARALSKDPAGRFASSSAFIRALIEAKGDVGSANIASQPECGVETSSVAASSTSVPTMDSHDMWQPDTATKPFRVRPAADHPMIARPVIDHSGTRRPTPARHTPAPPRGPAILQQVVSSDRLNGMPPEKVAASKLSKDNLVQAVVNAAARECRASEIVAPPDSIIRHFLCTLPAAIIPLKLTVIANPRNLKIDQSDPGRVILRHDNPPKARLFAKPRKSGYVVAVHYPAAQSAVMTMVGSLFGSQDRELVQRAEGEIAIIMDEIKKQLQTIVERRAHPRFRADYSVLAYPFYADGDVGTPVAGHCRDISEGGIRLISPVPIRASQIYVQFKDLEDVSGSGILVQIIRTGQEPDGGEFVTVGRFGAGV